MIDQDQDLTVTVLYVQAFALMVRTFSEGHSIRDPLTRARSWEPPLSYTTIWATYCRTTISVTINRRARSSQSHVPFHTHLVLACRRLLCERRAGASRASPGFASPPEPAWYPLPRTALCSSSTATPAIEIANSLPFCEHDSAPPLSP